MQFTTILTFAGVALSAVLGVSAQDGQDPQPVTVWVPTATVTAVQTFTATRVEEIWTDVPPYEWLTTFPVVWTATATNTEFMPIVTVAPPAERRHARDFQQA